MPESFTAADGDAWYRRNAAYILENWQPETDPALRLIDLYGLAPRIVLEIGCANGYRLAHLASRPELWRPYRAIGCDISPKAIADGRKRYPDLELHVCDANMLPVADGLVDIVICHFVFHWLQRRMLGFCAIEVDRVLKPGGILILGDFAPDADIDVPYHHRPDVFTYKRADTYAGLFTTTGRYREIAQLTYDHDTRVFSPFVPSERRAAEILLCKIAERGIPVVTGLPFQTTITWGG